MRQYCQKPFAFVKEYTRILRVLYTSNFLRPENSEKILNYMANSTFKDYLSAGIPSDIKFAHKYGENIEYNIFADSGIVYIPKKPYMISVIIKGENSTLETREKITKLMKEIGERAYQASK
jgi:beta-lactamase class A